MRVRVSRNSGVGLLLLLLAAALLAYGLAGKPNPFAHPRVVWAEFRDVSTITRFDRDVQVDGVDVGTVGRIKLQGQHALIQLLLDQPVGTIYANATAALRPHTLFDGNSYIELDPGAPPARPLGNHPIALSHTTNYVSLDLAMRTFSPTVRRALPLVLRDTQAVLTPATVDAIRRTVSDSPALFRSLVPALRAAAGPSGTELEGAIAGSARTVAAIAAAQKDIGPLLSSTATTVSAVRAGDTPLSGALAALPTALAAAAADSTTIEHTVTGLRTLSGELVPGVEQLAPTLRELRPWLRTATPVFTSATPFVGLLQTTLALIRANAPTGTTLLRDLMPTLTTTSSSIVPFLRSRMSTGATVNQALAGVASGGAGILAPAKTQAEGGTEGSGHGWHMTPSVVATSLGCDSIPAGTLRTIFAELSLCES